MKKFVLIAMVLTISAVLTIAAIQVVFVGNPTPNVGWNTWVPQYLDVAATPSPNTVCWSRIAPQPNVGWNT